MLATARVSPEGGDGTEEQTGVLEAHAGEKKPGELGRVHAHERGDGNGSGNGRSAVAARPDGHHREERVDVLDPLDPALRHAAHIAPPPTIAPHVAPEAPAAAPLARASLETLLPQLVRRVAWTHGDARRRAVRLEIGQGALAGATLLVHAEEGRVHVRLDAPAHVDAEAWRGRIAERLAKRGIDVDAIEVVSR